MKVVFIFPGCGSQFVGMTKELYDTHRIMQEYFEEASNCLDINFVKLCFASSDAELAKVSHATTSLFLVSSAVAALLMQEEITPALLIGFDDGQYSALHTASAISFPDGLYLLAKYSAFYEDFLINFNGGAAIVKGLPTQVLEELCLKASMGERQLFITTYLTVIEHIVAGSRVALDHLYDLANLYSTVSLDYYPVQAGLHSPLMQSVADQLRVYLEKIDFKDVKIPFLSGLDGHMVSHGGEVKKRVMEQIISPLHYTSLLDMLEQYDIIVEIASNTPLKHLIQSRYPNKSFITVKKQSDLEALQELVR